MPVFRPVDPKQSFPALEAEILALWRREKVFEQSVALRAGAPVFVFYEGPPTANGRPGVHHVLSRVFKDVFCRYKTMRGWQVPRKGGWDTQGLPVEIEVEKAMGLNGKPDIERVGVDKFNAACRASVFRYLQDWEKLTERIAFWVDTEHAYQTCTNDYIESCWAILRTLWDGGLVFQDYKVTMHCPRCGTSLADHEVAQGFKDDVVDPSVYVKLRVLPGQVLPFYSADADVTADGPTSFLVWTTTPWTLPANAAVALKGDATYALADVEGERYVVLADAVPAVLGEGARVLATARGEQLVGVQYEPLYAGVGLDGRPADTSAAYRALADETVLLGEGTGIVHIAPAYGDLEVGRRHGLPVLFSVDLSGMMLPAFAPAAGLFFKKADAKITADLKKRGLMWRAETVKHSYPFCWRCDTPLLYFAKSSWYIRTTARKDQMMALNATINWVPPFIGTGRFGDWLANNVDWSLSRERYWGTPLPFWRCRGCGASECIGSVAELERRAGQAPGAYAALDLHRPAVDAVEWPCDAAGCGGGVRRRVPEVADAWFDSGAMPYAQHHYPFENRELFARSFPSDFISEAVDQTRGWFYSLHALSTLLHGSVAYKNCVVLGHILDGQGRKMSKRLGNIVDPWTVLDSEGCDALRWYFFTASPPWQPRRFSPELVQRSLRSFLLPLWNVYSFFVTYGNLELEALGRRAVPPAERPRIDQWVLAALHALVEKVTAQLDAYDVTGAGRAIEGFVDELSTWYVRRNRDRFWRRLGGGGGGGAGGAGAAPGGPDDDKLAAYLTLEECLVTVAKLIAPFAPFLAEDLYQNLVRRRDAAAPATERASAPVSVHLCDFPVADPARIDRALLEETAVVQRVVTLGRAVREKHELSTRQPLAEAHVAVPNAATQAAGAVRRFEREIRDELNVKKVTVVERAGDLVRYKVRTNIALLGKKLRNRLPPTTAALQAADAAAVAVEVLAGRPFTVTLGDGSQVTLAPDEIEVMSEAAPGFAAAEDQGYVVALSTAVTPELRMEGIAREVARRVSELRKGAQLVVEATIATLYAVEPAAEHPALVRDALTAHREYLMSETLSRTFDEVDGAAIAAGPHAAVIELAEGRIHLAIRPVS
jgi:isoleucyl-tRNA synthetase